MTHRRPGMASYTIRVCIHIPLFHPASHRSTPASHDRHDEALRPLERGRVAAEDAIAGGTRGTT
ncbi:hypothetical protein C8Q80DRAFT_1194897 [Daedaleopsis nitida]|nr:hypothetical protein C8Q80DRAFT_1194897 [Daedaleopsis nitida]